MNYAIKVIYKNGGEAYLHEGNTNICSFPSRAAAVRQKQAMEAKLTTRTQSIEVVPFPREKVST
jgi:hypothetical protein